MENCDSVLERMQQTLQELAGFSVNDASDLGIRLKVLVGEIYSLLNGVEWLKSQMFPQTVQGEYLMMHTAQRGFSRKGVTPSSGTSVFGRSGTLPYDVLIPKGMVCAVSGGAGPRFETTQDIMLSADAQTTWGPAVSQQGGKESNVAARVVTLLPTPPAGVETVANPQVFTGDADEETDEELRKRLLKSHEVLPDGINAEFHRSYVVQHDGIQSASILPKADGGGTVAIYAADRGAVLPQALLTKIQSELNSPREANVEVTVHSPELVGSPTPIYIDPVPGCTLAAATSQTLEVIQPYFDQPFVGESVILAQLGRRLIDTGLIRSYHFDETLTKDKKMEIAQLAVSDPVYMRQMGSVVQHEGDGFHVGKTLAAPAVSNGRRKPGGGEVFRCG